MESLNRMAIELVDEAIDFADELDIAIHHLENDAVVLDFGVTTTGGIEAGLLLTEIQTSGLATVQTTLRSIDGVPFPFVEFATDHPVRAVYCSQTTRWTKGLGSIDGIGSGPAQFLASDSRSDHCREYQDEFDLTVLVIESESLPSEAVADQIATETGVSPSGVFMPVVAPGSTAGGVLRASRAGLNAVHRLVQLGFPSGALQSIQAHAPVPPVTDDASRGVLEADIGIALGAQVYLVVDDAGDTFDQFDRVPFDGDVAHITADRPGHWNEDGDERGGPAQVTIDVRSGPTISVGSVHTTQLRDRWI